MDKRAMLKYIPMFNFVAMIRVLLYSRRKLADKKTRTKVALAICGCTLVSWLATSLFYRIPNEAASICCRAAVTYLWPLTATIAAEKLIARSNESN